jgi:thiol-disulfide isomerase/thioredoxin
MTNELNEVEGKVIFFMLHANWCGHCVHFKPTWNELKKKHGNKNFLFIDVEESLVPPIYPAIKNLGFPSIFMKIKNEWYEIQERSELEQIINALLKR